jgi:hypothetical protein
MLIRNPIIRISVLSVILLNKKDCPFNKSFTAVKKILQAKYITIFALSMVGAAFVALSIISAFYMNRGYAIPTLILTVAAIAMAQKEDRRNQ